MTTRIPESTSLGRKMQQKPWRTVPLIGDPRCGERVKHRQTGARLWFCVISKQKQTAGKRNWWCSSKAISKDETYKWLHAKRAILTVWCFREQNQWTLLIELFHTPRRMVKTCGLPLYCTSDFQLSHGISSPAFLLWLCTFGRSFKNPSFPEPSRKVR